MAICEFFTARLFHISHRDRTKIQFFIEIFIEIITKNEIQSNERLGHAHKACVPRIFIRDVMFIKFTLFAFHVCLAKNDTRRI